MSQRTLGSIEDAIDGYVLRPGHHGYESNRRVFNKMVDRKPSAIVRCRTVADAVAAVTISADSSVPFTLRAGGHHVAGLCVADEAIMIDLSELRRVVVDPRMATATVEPGAVWADFDRAAFRYELAATGGLISHTGVAGLTLGGGLGWLMGSQGLSCDNLIEVRVLDGTLQSHNVDSNGDLWAFRGAGRSLGFVSELTFKLSPIPSVTFGGRIKIPQRRTDAVLRSILEQHLELPNELTISPAISPDTNAHSSTVAVDFFSTLSHEATHSALERVLDMRVAPDAVHARSYTEQQVVMDDTLRFGRRNYWKSQAFASLQHVDWSAVLEHVALSPSSQSMLTLDLLHGRALAEPSGGSAYSLRSRPAVSLANAIWSDGEADESNIDWCRNLQAMLSNEDAMTYGNYQDVDDLGEIRTQTDDVAARLTQIKLRRDPDHVFPDL